MTVSENLFVRIRLFVVIFFLFFCISFESGIVSSRVVKSYILVLLDKKRDLEYSKSFFFQNPYLIHTAVLDSFMTRHRTFTQCNKTVTTNGERNHPSRAHEITSGF